MKSEREFLASMWSEIDTQEAEARQKLITHELNRRLFIREVFAYGIILMVLAAGTMIAFFVKDNPETIYAVAVLIFTAAFLVERIFYSKSQGVVVDENRNYY